MEGTPTSVPSQTFTKEPENPLKEVQETPAPTTSEAEVNEVIVEAGESSGKTLDDASDLMDKGSKAMKDGDFSEAAECFSRAVEIKVASFGELSPECSSAYYKYGCALLYKAQEEADPLGVVPKKEATTEEVPNKGSSVETVKDEVDEQVASSTVSEAKQDSDSSDDETDEDDVEEGADEKDQVENEGKGGEDEDLADPDEDDSDLDLAWKMLDLARAIAEKNPNDTIEKVDILSALGEVALEREDIETSLNDYLNALSILGRLVEPDNRQIAELNFRICLVLEVGSKPEEAIPYCKKAISVCQARLQRLADEMKGSTSSTSAVVVPNSEQNVVGSESGLASDKENEIETLTGLSTELEKKLEDLQQLVLYPTSALSDVLKMVSERAKGNEKNASLPVVSSSQKGMNTSNNGDIDSPTVSTAHTNGSSSSSSCVTHLGVVGRGVKRVLMTPAEPSKVKKPSLGNGEGSGS